MGQPTIRQGMVPASEFIGCRGAPPELKHLSRARKREYSPSSGERTGRSPNRARLSGLMNLHRGGVGRPAAEGHQPSDTDEEVSVVEPVWNAGPETVRAR